MVMKRKTGNQINGSVPCYILSIFKKLIINELLCSHEKDNRESHILKWKLLNYLYIIKLKKQIIK